MNLSNSILKINKAKCCGCGSCEQICPKKAIKMREDDEGFKYPVIDENLCVNCGMCVKSCHITKKTMYDSTKISIKAFKGDNSYRLNSASGGFATFCAMTVIELGGVVCGCALIDNKARHIIVKDKESLKLLQSSKYIQSDTNTVYSEIKSHLINGDMVLFIGTPCQVAGLICYLNKKYDNLITIDLICHGVPSQKLFDMYVKSLSIKEKSEIVEYNFRYKLKSGWGTNYYYKTAKGNVKTGPLIKDKYGSDFLSAVNYRESCYLCEFSNINNRPGDFTIGDFWGIDRGYTNDNYGTSTVVVNTQKGDQFLKSLDPGSCMFDISMEDALLCQSNLVEPTKRPKSRDDYYKNIDEFYFLRNKVHLSITQRIKLICPKWIKKKLKKILKRH